MFKKNNKENLKPITLNIPKMILKNQINQNSIQQNAYLIETSRSPRISQLYQKIQQSIDQKPADESQDVVSFHQQKIREKIRGYNQTPTITTSQDIEDSFNIWNDEQQLDGNIIENYTQRYKSYDNFIQNNVSQNEIAENILKLLGMKHKVKNLGKIPFLNDEPKKTTNYFVPPQKAWRLYKKRPLNFTSTLYTSNQTTQLINSKSRLNSLEIQNQNQSNLRQLSSPDILKIKFKQLKMK
ncbi:unnamed protein product [Paramecium primaurelia]|uniref:Uncharacterized protein n=1 Tax=Paramecium primaurelia TaxID=5886 RepID=A0A8S1MMZ1_PARPR|nr:unnamed protein product [Paramecium primaurelia]